MTLVEDLRWLTVGSKQWMLKSSRFFSSLTWRGKPSSYTFIFIAFINNIASKSQVTLFDIQDVNCYPGFTEIVLIILIKDT